TAGGRANAGEGGHLDGAFADWEAAQRTEAAGRGETVAFTVVHRDDGRTNRAEPVRTLVLTEQREGRGRCWTGPRVVTLEASSLGAASVVGDRRLGLDCCTGASCPDRTPAGWTLRLLAALAANDVAAVRALAPPRAGVELRIEGEPRQFNNRSRDL